MTLHATFRSSTWGRAVVALTMTLLALVATTSAADAADTADAAGGTRAGVDFAAQAESQGLDRAQARSLQNRVDGYLAEEGGKQVAANRIELDSGGFLLLALPGETYARDLAAPVATRGAAAACPYTYVCAYSQENFTGDFKALFTCNTLNPIPWTGTGSWKNNQRAELRARFYDSAGNVGWTSPGGYSEDAHAPWGWVYWLSPC
ncbi:MULTISPECIES: peptidase inhibitor family I36 protein [unclassified Streptomyces]|uniref:peptidase inhibitor family I36 protein n=1 Tax=unclassified Streptomyces TaxID=2593676 RepID=UPI0009C24ADB|nr:peptidase inhibitor family I36 protein [Streptomyces sp. Sge12]ARE78354.1 hypothetical protein B6R96_34085 [Streptomyces sp. Sge12]